MQIGVLHVSSLAINKDLPVLSDKQKFLCPTPEEAALRKPEEETGYTAEKLEWLERASLPEKDSFWNNLNHTSDFRIEQGNAHGVSSMLVQLEMILVNVLLGSFNELASVCDDFSLPPYDDSLFAPVDSHSDIAIFREIANLYGFAVGLNVNPSSVICKEDRYNVRSPLGINRGETCQPLFPLKT